MEYEPQYPEREMPKVINPQVDETSYGNIGIKEPSANNKENLKAELLMEKPPREIVYVFPEYGINGISFLGTKIAEDDETITYEAEVDTAEVVEGKPTVAKNLFEVEESVFVGIGNKISEAHHVGKTKVVVTIPKIRKYTDDNLKNYNPEEYADKETNHRRR